MITYIKPLGRTALILPDEPNKSRSGLILPFEKKSKTVTGTVLKTGKILLRENNTVKPEDRVLIKLGVGKKIKIDGYTFLLVKEADIEAII